MLVRGWLFSGNVLLFRVLPKKCTTVVVLPFQRHRAAFQRQMGLPRKVNKHTFHRLVIFLFFSKMVQLVKTNVLF